VFYDISNNNTTSVYGSNYLSLMSLRQDRQQSFNDSYTALILEESEKLYNKLTTKLTNDIMAAAAAMSASSLPPANNRQKLTHKNDTYQTEEPRYNNQS
jgi:hypothetical protein